MKVSYDNLDRCYYLEYENGFISVRAKNFVDDFDNQVRDGVQSLFERLTLNEQTKEDLKKAMVRL